MAETPQDHQPDYKAQAWEAYSLFELGMWVHLFAKRAEHRQNPEKRDKDLHDARNYLAMMQSKLDKIAGDSVGPFIETKLTMGEWMKIYKEDPSRLGIPTSGHLKENPLVIRETEARIRKMEAETAALHTVHERNVAQQRKAAGLDPRLFESDPFALCPKMTQSERED